MSEYSAKLSFVVRLNTPYMSIVTCCYMYIYVSEFISKKISLDRLLAIVSY